MQLLVDTSNASKLATKKVTINHVAELANVSAATVSLVMQQKGKLAQETRDRVNQAALAVGYVRKENREKKRRRPASYWFIVDDIGNPYFHEIYRSVCDSIGQRDAVVSVLSSEDSLETQASLLGKCAALKVNGLILVPASGTQTEHLAEFLDARLPFILAVRNIGVGHLDYVGGNPMMGMRLATEHLVELGHRRIGFIGGYPSNYAYHERYAGFTATMSQHGLSVDERHIISGGSSKAFGRKTATALLASENPPTALIGYNGLVSIGIMSALSGMGLRAGRDIAVVGYDEIPEASEQTVPLTTVATPARNLGRMIANALRRIVNDPEHAPINVTQPPCLVVRESCGASLRETNL